jgi:hypothetical protein
MLFRSFFRYLKWNSRRYLRNRPNCRQMPLRNNRPRRCVPRLEALEDRTALSTLTVTSAADDGSANTLRAVLATAQNGDSIQFAGGLGVFAPALR